MSRDVLTNAFAQLAVKLQPQATVAIVAAYAVTARCALWTLVRAKAAFINIIALAINLKVTALALALRAHDAVDALAQRMHAGRGDCAIIDLKGGGGVSGIGLAARRLAG